MYYHVNEALIGTRIRDKRIKKGISQQKLSSITGIQNTTISAFENGGRTPSLYNLASIAQALDVTIDELYFGDSSKAFIESAPNKGAKIANCIYELVKEGVISAPIAGKTPIRNDTLLVNRYILQIQRLVNNSEEFFLKKNTYSNPDEFSKQMVESVANEINQQDEEIKEKKRQIENLRGLSI